MEHRPLITLVAVGLVAAACARPEATPRDDRPASSNAPTDAAAENPIPRPIPRGALPPAPAELWGDAAPRQEAQDPADSRLGASPAAWDSEHHVTVTFVVTPEPAGFPTGAFRAATKMCLAETKTVVPSETTLGLTLGVDKTGHVDRVQFAGTAELSEAMQACLRKLYTKVALGKTKGPLGASLTLSP
ncbi:MAG: hypothetical protein U0235_34695 [Polyangiaceae bacterium]